MRWTKIIGWTVAGILGLLIIVAVGGYFYLKSTSFQQFALHKIVEEADTATGGKTTIGSLDFSLSTLTAHLYNITMRGTEAADQPPLLHADKLTVSLKIVSALHRQVNLSELVIEHPVVHLQVNKAGKNNLPTAPPSQSSSHTSVFDLAVRHAQITNGEVDYNDQKTPLEADLYDLGTDIHYVPVEKRYDGALSYKDGRLRYAQYSPLAHNLNVKFSATPDRFGLQSAVLRVGDSSVTLHAQVTDYSNPVGNGDYQIRLHTQDFAQMMQGTSAAGDVLLNGQLHYQPNPNEPMMRAVAVNGQIASELLRAASSGKKVEMRNLKGTYQLAGGRLQVRNLSVDTFGGNLVANVDMRNLDTTPDAQVRAALHSISLRALQQAAGQQASQTAALSGTLNGTAQAGWKGPISNLRAKSDLTLHALAASKSNPSAANVPVNGAIHLTYDGPRQALALQQTSLRIPSATITANGEISDRSSLIIQVAANDLHQLAALASSFRSTTSTPPAVSGTASLNAVVHGSIKKPTVTGQLNAQNLRVEGSQWSTVRLDLQADPSHFAIQNGALVNAEKGQATFSANVALRNWSYEPSDPIKATLNAQQLRIGDLQRLANVHYPISGDLTANVSVKGTQLNPVGSGSAQIANLRAYDEPVQKFALQFRAENGTIVSTLNVAAPAGAIDANLSYTPKTKAYKVKLDAPSIVLQKLRTVQEKNMQLAGQLSASVNGQGTVDDPQLNAVVQMPQLQMKQNSIAGLKAEVRVAQHAADLTLDSSVAKASIRARGHMALTGDYQTDASIDTNLIPIESVLAAYAAGGAPQGFTGQAELHATLKGPLKSKSQLQAHLTIPVLKASYQEVQIGIANPIRADYANSVVTLQPAEIRGTGTQLRMQGRIPVAGNAPASLTAQGSVDMRILKLVSSDIQSSGVIALNVDSTGSAKNPDVQGKVEFKDVAVATTAAPVGVEKLNGTLDITKDHVQFTTLNGQVGGGSVSVGGSIAYRPSLQFNLAMKGQNVRLRYPEGLRTLLVANLAFSGNMEASSLNGRLLIDNLSFTPDFDLSKFGDQFSTGTNTPTQPGFADNVQLQIGVQSQTLNATSSQVSIGGHVALQVVGTAANPVITGRTNLTSGELFYRNVRYQLQKGVITFDNPNETHPVLNVAVTTTVQQYNLTLSMRGPLDKLTTEYTSDPPLATADIINLIVRGETTEQAAASSTSTDSMIASGAASKLSSSVQKLAGISSLQIDPLIGGNNSNPSARIGIQQRVTKNLFFTFSTDVSQPGAEMVQGDYQLTKHWSVSMSRDQLGGVSVDGRYHTKF